MARRLRRDRYGYFCLRRRKLAPTASKPVPINAKVPGSGALLVNVTSASTKRPVGPQQLVVVSEELFGTVNCRVFKPTANAAAVVKLSTPLAVFHIPFVFWLVEGAKTVVSLPLGFRTTVT